MEIREVEIAELKESEYNPRKISNEQYSRLKKAIKEFDYIDPIVWNEKTGNVVGGHQRLRVLKELDYQKIDVSVVHLNKTKEKALNLALNKTGGDWDKNKLKDVIMEIDTGEFDVELTGFGEEEIEKLMTEFHKEEDHKEMEFTEELMEEHNYIVMYFDNQLDWQVAKEKFDIKTVHALDSKEGYERKGVGRVLKGSDVLDLIE